MKTTGTQDPGPTRVGNLIVELDGGRVRLVWIGRKRAHLSTTEPGALAEVLYREVIPVIVDELTVPIPGQMTLDDVLSEIDGSVGIDDEAA